MSDIYEQHKASFGDVSAFVIAKGGGRVATIAIKFPRDGAGRLYAYVHWLGTEMVRGFASGGGYDKRSAACANAARKHIDKTPSIDVPQRVFWSALAKNGGLSWDGELRQAGFEVWSAV